MIFSNRKQLADNDRVLRAIYRDIAMTTLTTDLNFVKERLRDSETLRSGGDG